MKLESQGQCEDCGGYLKYRRIFADYCPVCTPFRALLLGAVFWGAVITLALSLFIYLVWGMMNGFTPPFPIDPVLLVGMALCWVWASFLYLRVLGVVGGAYGGGYFGGGNGGGGNGGG